MTALSLYSGGSDGLSAAIPSGAVGGGGGGETRRLPMIRCTHCNAYTKDWNPIGGPSPEWVCEDCGGRDGYTPPRITREMATAYLSATGWRLTYQERFTSASHERWAHPMAERILCLSWPLHGDYDQHTTTDEEVARAIAFIADLEGIGCDEAAGRVLTSDAHGR